MARLLRKLRMLFGDINFPSFQGPQYPIRFCYTMLAYLPGHWYDPQCSSTKETQDKTIILEYKLTKDPSLEINPTRNQGTNLVDKHVRPSALNMIQNNSQVSIGEDKRFPKPLPDSEGYVVEFEGADDPEHPQNWRLSIKSVTHRINPNIQISEY